MLARVLCRKERPPKGQKGCEKVTLLRSTTAASQPHETCSLLRKFARQLWSNGIFCILTSSSIFSVATLCVKLTGSRVPVLQLALIRCSFSILLSIVVGLWVGIPLHLLFGQRQHYGVLAIRGFLGSCGLITGYLSLFNLPIADSVVIGQLNPPITALAAWVILKEPLAPRGMLGCLLSLLGVVVLAHPPWLSGGGHDAWGWQRLLGTAMGVLSATLGAGSYICIRAIGSAEPALVVALWFYCATVAVTSLPVLVSFPQHAVLLSVTDTMLVLALSLLGFVGLIIMTRGFQLTTAGKASAIGFTGVIWAYFWGITIFHEHITSMGLVGTICVLVGVLLVTIKPKAAADNAAAAAAAGAAVITPYGSRCASTFSAASVTSAGTPVSATGGGGSGIFQPRSPTVCPACYGRSGSQLRSRITNSGSLPRLLAAATAAVAAATAASPEGSPQQSRTACCAGREGASAGMSVPVGRASRDGRVHIHVYAGSPQACIIESSNGLKYSGSASEPEKLQGGVNTAAMEQAREAKQQQHEESRTTTDTNATAGGPVLPTPGSVPQPSEAAMDVEGAVSAEDSGAAATTGAAAASAVSSRSTTSNSLLFSASPISLDATSAVGPCDDGAEAMARPLLAPATSQHQEDQQQRLSSGGVPPPLRQQQQFNRSASCMARVHEPHRHHHHHHDANPSPSPSSTSASASPDPSPCRYRSTSLFALGAGFAGSPQAPAPKWSLLRSLLLLGPAGGQRQAAWPAAGQPLDHSRCGSAGACGGGGYDHGRGDDGHVAIDLPLQQQDGDSEQDNDEEQGQEQHPCAYCCGTGSVPVMELARATSCPLTGIASAGSSAAIHGHDSHLHM